MWFGYQVEKTRFRRFGIEEKKRNGSDFFNGKVCLVQNLDFSEKKKRQAAAPMPARAGV